MTLTSDVVVVGNAGVDTNVYLRTPEINFSVEANFTENIDSVGQAGGFASRLYSHLGDKVAYLGFLGEDPAGDLVRVVFQKEGIDIPCRWCDPAGTARSVNLVYPNGNRKNFYDGKSHMDQEIDPVD